MKLRRRDNGAEIGIGFRHGFGGAGEARRCRHAEFVADRVEDVLIHIGDGADSHAIGQRPPHLLAPMAGHAADADHQTLVFGAHLLLPYPINGDVCLTIKPAAKLAHMLLSIMDVTSMNLL